MLGKALSLCRLGGLRPQLHQKVDHNVRAEGKNHHNTRISPANVVVADVESGQIIAPEPILTDSATRRRFRVDQIGASTQAGPVRSEIILTCLIVRRVEKGKLVLFALHHIVEDGKSQNAADEVVERIQVVDPVAPEFLDLCIWYQHSAKRHEHRDEDWVDKRCENGIGCVCRDELSDPSVDELVKEHDEEDGPGLVGVGGEANGVVPRREVQNCTDAQVREFETIRPVTKATHEYIFDFFSRNSYMSRRSMKSG